MQNSNLQIHGPAFEFMDGYETFWSYVPHFVHSPFYVYAYAFGDGLVNALYAVYAEGDPAFADKYFEMLKAGGSKHHKELLAPFGLDASDPGFWDKGLDLISSRRPIPPVSVPWPRRGCMPSRPVPSHPIVHC